MICQSAPGSAPGWDNDLSQLNKTQMIMEIIKHSKL
ncbi:unnamed protein product, partial [Staurois parvus]